MKPIAESNVTVLVEQLGNRDPVVRESSRKKLVSIGGQAVVHELIQLMENSQPKIRWEAARALQELGDPLAAPVLLSALNDSDSDVRWVCGKALVALGVVGLRSVLQGLLQHADSATFRISAHHVLHDLRLVYPVVADVLKSLETPEPAVTAPPAAFRALNELDVLEDQSRTEQESRLKDLEQVGEDMVFYHRSSPLDE